MNIHKNARLTLLRREELALGTGMTGGMGTSFDLLDRLLAEGAE